MSDDFSDDLGVTIWFGSLSMVEAAPGTTRQYFTLLILTSGLLLKCKLTSIGAGTVPQRSEATYSQILCVGKDRA